MSDKKSQFSLLGQRRFGPFFLTQFSGAFNDNVFKNSLMILIAYQTANLTSLSSDVLVNLAGALLVLPFFLFSATAGQLADKYDKARIARAVKLLEIVIALVGSAGFIMNSLPLLLTALFLFGTHSAFFGPIKYSILPQHLDEHELVGGNGLVEMGTFLAILLGTVMGGLLIAAPAGASSLVPVGVVTIACLGYLASRWIPPSPGGEPGLRVSWNLPLQTWRNLRFARDNRTVFLSLLGISWFWFFGALILSQFPNYTRNVLGGAEGVVTLLLGTLSVGIGVGSLLCERLSGRMVEVGLVPFGSLGMTVFGIDLALASPDHPGAKMLGVGAFLTQPGSLHLLLDLALVGVFSGIFIVPLYALVQSRSERSHQSRIIAANNILNAIFMVVAALFSATLLGKGYSIPQLYLVGAIMNAAVALFIYKLVPEFLYRFLAWLLMHTVYRVEKEGVDFIPASGPALLVCNHVSYVDALLLLAASPRPIRFVMHKSIFRIPLLSWFFRQARAIPIAGAKEDPRLLEAAFEAIAQALREGYLVGIFPEGGLTLDGELAAFRPGLTRVLGETPVPVIPMALQGLWGSWFSRRGGRAMARLPRGLLAPVGIRVGPGIGATEATPELLRERVLALRGERR